MNSWAIVFLFGLVVCEVCADYLEDSWQEPNAWERHSPSVLVPNTCPVCEAVEDGAPAAFYYKKLVANLFNKNTLKENKNTGRLERAVIFSLTHEQLDALEKSGDIRDLDAVVTSILTAAKVPANWGTRAKEGGGFLWLVGDILNDVWKLFGLVLSNSEGRFLFFAVGVIMLIWFIHKHYNKNIVLVVGIGFVLFGYFFTYLECNRKLEAEKVIAFVKQSDPEEVGWLRRTFSSIFKSTEQDRKVSNIERQSKINLPFCRPDHVLMMYINEMFLNQFQLVIEKCVEMSISFKDKIPFPYNIAAMIALPFLFMGIIKLVFKHILSPVAWYKVLRTESKQPQSPQHQEPKVDRLSGDNLRKFLEFIDPNRTKVENPLLPSGVQDILEAPSVAALECKADESTGDDNVKNKDIDENKNSVESNDNGDVKDETKDAIKNSNAKEVTVKRRGFFPF